VTELVGPKSGRKPRADGERSRQTILAAAARLATTDGLDGLSIGRLAEHIGMSKSGLYAHFGSKEDLQLATIETAADIFRVEVTEPAEQAETPRKQIAALCEEFLAHVERRTFPGGCFFAATTVEFDARPGVIRERLAAFRHGWLELLAQLVREAQAQGELAGEDPDQLAFELTAFLVMANTTFVLHDDPGALARGRGAVAARLSGTGAPVG
jgi:AcrR family transcriptional regulator